MVKKTMMVWISESRMAAKSMPLPEELCHLPDLVVVMGIWSLSTMAMVSKVIMSIIQKSMSRQVCLSCRVICLL